MILDRLNEGGSLFMYTLLFVLIICSVLIIKEFLKPAQKSKTLEILKSLSLFALVWGFLGLMIGLIVAFDAISFDGEINPGILAGGLKVGLLSPTFGAFTFLVIRLGIIGLILKKK
jgi:hypothetical protein